MAGPTNGRTNKWPDQQMAGARNDQTLDFFKTVNGQNSNHRIVISELSVQTQFRADPNPC